MSDISGRDLASTGLSSKIKKQVSGEIKTQTFLNDNNTTYSRVALVA